MAITSEMNKMISSHDKQEGLMVEQNGLNTPCVNPLAMALQ